MNNEAESDKKPVGLFDKNFSEIPCFRESYLYGISTGIAAGLAYFMLTSKTKMSSHVGMGSFVITTLSYWTVCRTKWKDDAENALKLKEYMRLNAPQDVKRLPPKAEI